MLAKFLNRSAEKITAKPNSRLGYLPALDGLRALAVLAVLLYHADIAWLPGGFLGVEIFFVVSGYLITSLLLAEYRTNNSINLKQFWQRRARRLLPALFAVIVAVLVYAVFLLPEEVASLRGDVVAAFTYITNWYLIVAQQSYFETMGRPSLLRHLWSLAVEEQFYLLWPLIFVVLLARLKSRAAMLLLMVGATVSALWMGAQYNPDADPSRIYYGTDTRAAGLLIGAALAFVWMPRASEKKDSKLRRWTLDLVGIGALLALVVACVGLSEFDPFLYQGGMLLVAAATALVIAAVVSPQSPLFAGVLGFGVLRWIGLRSYSLYLWHWPVFMVTRPQLDTTLEGIPLLALRLAVTFALAEISFRLIESPLRNGALGNAWSTWKGSQGVRRWGLSVAGVAVIAISLFGAVSLGNAVVLAKPPEEPDYILMTAEEEGVSAEASILEPPDAETQVQEQASIQEEASSDLEPVSYLLGEEVASGNVVPDATSSMDNWLRALVAAHTLVGNSIQAETDASQLQRAESTTKTVRPTCNEQCQDRLELAQTKDSIVRHTAPTAPAVASKPVTVTQPVTASKPVAPPPTKKVAVNKPLPPRTGPAPILAIGDSVMLGATHYFRKAGLDAEVDAKTGRQVSAAIKLLRERKNANLLAPTVIIHLGNNGTFTAKQFDEMMTVLQDVPRVIFLTTKVPRKWQDPNNAALLQGVQKYPNARLVDWKGASNQHAEWFWKDGIHLRPEGAQVYVNLIAQTLN